MMQSLNALNFPQRGTNTENINENENYSSANDAILNIPESSASSNFNGEDTNKDISEAPRSALASYTEFNSFSRENLQGSECACAYCGIDSPNTVIKCNTCDKWFCNAKNSLNGSHIVTHLIFSRHNTVSLHKDSDLGDTTLECYNCGNKNVFLLGFVNAKQDSVVVILCRLPCAQLKDINWDTSGWQSLIENKRFLPWLAVDDPEDSELYCDNISHKQIVKLENQWRLNRNATINDVNVVNEEEEEILPIIMRYNDAFQYQRSFAPLVQMEAEYDKNLKESQALEHISVKWSLGLNHKHMASFNLSTFETSELKIAVGDEMVLRYNGIDGEPWEGCGYVVRLPNAYQDKFTLELIPHKIQPPIHLTTNFTAEFVWKGTSYERMQKAMKDFALDEKSVSSYIYHKILGHEVAPVEFEVKLPKNLSLPSLDKLNESQTNAVKNVLCRPLSLIQGPPGTGKTVTSATIVYHLSKLSKSKVLVCAPSNVAVDHLAAKLNLSGLKVVRLTAKSREDVESSVDHLALHNLVFSTAKGELKRLLTLKNEVNDLSEENSKQLRKLNWAAESRIFRNCDVICTTCVGAGDKRISNMRFRTVLIDESTQASEPEVLIPIVKGAKQVILVGDHQQLGPVILDKRVRDAGLVQSLFERLVVLGCVPTRLEVQYRMNPCLSSFPSNMFYEGSLQNGVTEKDRYIPNFNFPWPVPHFPMMFWANYGREEISNNGNSFLNRVEAMNVEKIITRLFKVGIKPEQIGVITPYEGQRSYILQYMMMNSTILELKNQYLEVEVTSVDAFQGREKDFIILSCVRANDQQVIGFLSDPRRLNVALTRAKYGLIILGNPRALSRNMLWNHLLIHFREKGCLVDGTLDNLQLSTVQLNNGRKNNASSLLPNNFRKNKNDFDTTSLLSFAPDNTPSSYKNWPSLDNESAREKVDSVTPMTSSLADKLNSKLISENHYDYSDINEEIKNITSSFAANFI